MLTVLNPSHLNLCLELSKNNPGVHKLGVKFNDFILIEEFYLQKLSNNYTVGWIENNQLLSIASVRNFYQPRTWIWDFYGCIKLPYTNWDKTKGHLVISEVFKEVIKNKGNSVVYSVRSDFPALLSNATGNLEKKLSKWHELIPELSYFHWVDEEHISAGTPANNKWMQQLIGSVAIVDLKIRVGIMKQEYRKQFIFNNSEL